MKAEDLYRLFEISNHQCHEPGFPGAILKDSKADAAVTSHTNQRMPTRIRNQGPEVGRISIPARNRALALGFWESK